MAVTPAALRKNMGVQLRAGQRALERRTPANTPVISVRACISGENGNLLWCAHVILPDGAEEIWNGRELTGLPAGQVEDAAYTRAIRTWWGEFQARVVGRFGVEEVLIHSSQPKVVEAVSGLNAGGMIVVASGENVVVSRVISGVLHTMREQLVAKVEKIKAASARKTLTIATDGSAGYGQAGAGFIAENGVFEGHGLSKLTTGASSDVLLAEMYAMYFALSRFSEHRGRLIIRSDSRQAIALAKRALDGECHHAKPAVQHVQTLLRTLAPKLEAKAIEFQWVKGHSGDLLNEVADTVAVLARRHMQAGIPLGESRSRIEVYVRQALAAQNADAGWAQTPTVSSVALAA